MLLSNKRALTFLVLACFMKPSEAPVGALPGACENQQDYDSCNISCLIPAKYQVIGEPRMCRDGTYQGSPQSCQRMSVVVVIHYLIMFGQQLLERSLHAALGPSCLRRMKGIYCSL